MHHCTDPEHHVDDAAGFVAAVERACRERGLRLTPIRAHVLQLIADAGQPIKAYDLLDRVRSGDAAEISFHAEDARVFGADTSTN